MGHRGREYLLYSLIAGCLALLLGGTLAVIWRFPWGTPELKAARARWAARPFSHYRMALEYGLLGYCRQIVEVENERVVAVPQNTCSNPPPTVDDLFDRIERDLATISGRCGPNGCACDGTIVVTAAYDAQFGYPHAKSVYLNQRARWLFLDYWKRKLSGDFCSYRDFGRDNVTVIALTPIT